MPKIAMQLPDIYDQLEKPIRDKEEKLKKTAQSRFQDGLLSAANAGETSLNWQPRYLFQKRELIYDDRVILSIALIREYGMGNAEADRSVSYMHFRRSTGTRQELADFVQEGLNNQLLRAALASGLEKNSDDKSYQRSKNEWALQLIEMGSLRERYFYLTDKKTGLATGLIFEFSALSLHPDQNRAVQIALDAASFESELTRLGHQFFSAEN